MLEVNLETVMTQFVHQRALTIWHSTVYVIVSIQTEH